MVHEGLRQSDGHPVRVRVEGARIAAVEVLPEGPDRRRAEEEWPSICPGFIDLQLNGYAGIDYSAPDLDGSAIEALVRAVAASGTTRHLATLVTGPRERLVANCATIAAARREGPLAAEALAGIHVEGPFISPVDGPRGAHDGRQVRKPDYGEFLEWQEAAEGAIRIVTLAPELEGALDFIEKLAAEGVVPAIGHTAAPPETIRAAVSAGARLSTHLGNGCQSLLPRLQNHLWEQLGEDRLMASVIADGFHLPDAVLRVFARAKGGKRLILVSDAASLAGSPPGLRDWGGISVEVSAEGRLSLAGTEFLAGAGHLLDRGIARLMQATGMGLAEAARLCTVNPARLLGLPAEALELLPGAPATLARFRAAAASSKIRIETCVIGGDVVYGR